MILRLDTIPNADRVWLYLEDRIERVSESGCWLWTGYLQEKGYGHVYLGAKGRARAHRFVYQLIHGEIPAHLQIDHLCRVRCCVNPAHMEVVTMEENVRRQFAVNGLSVNFRKAA